MKNLYKVLNIIALVAVIALMGGCFSPWAGDGATITINVGGGSGRAVFPPDDATFAQIRYTVELQGPSNITEQLAYGTQSINLSVIPGDYTITVTAYIDGELYAISIATAVARAGQSTRVDITMNYVGDGFIIFFDTNGGSSIEPKIIKRGDKVERPDNPTWGYYGFVNWYSDKDLKNKFDFDTPVTSSITSKITLYAKWNQVTHTVTFMGDDGGTLSTEVVGDGGTLPQPEDLIRNGSVFGGWYIDDNEYVFSTEIYSDITLYANWNGAIFNIADLGAYLSEWSANDPENPYTISLKVNDISTLRTTLNDNADKYVYLDLSGSNIETIPNITFYGSANPRGCATLVGITIPDGVETIGNSAFNSCSNLTSVTIGSGVTSIGILVFSSCPLLEEININPGNNNYSSDNGVLYNIDKTTLIAYPSAKGSITIPDGVTTIGTYAFGFCTNLTSITIGSEGETIGIGSNAFEGCTNLTSIIINANIFHISTSNAPFMNIGSPTISVTIGDGVTTIGERAFAALTNLTSITIPDGVTTIGNSAFVNCTNLNSVTIGSGVTSIGNTAFNRTSLTSITIPNSVTTIGQYTFQNCTSLTSVTFATGSSITNENFGSLAFPEGTNGNGGDTLKNAYNTASTKAGTYTRQENTAWTKSP
jgi:hypothetical protein